MKLMPFLHSREVEKFIKKEYNYKKFIKCIRKKERNDEVSIFFGYKL